MKKYLVLMMLAIAAFGFTGCSNDDNTKADLRWINKYGNDVSEIQWMADTTSENQKWTGTYHDQDPTGYKGITKLTGSGECIFSGGSGVPQPIELDDTDSDVEGISVNGTNSVVVSENASATLVIRTIGK